MKQAIAAPAPRWSLGVLLTSLVCTLALFLAVPLLDSLRPLGSTSLRTVREMPLLPPEPPPLPPLFEAAPPPPEPPTASPAVPLPPLPAPPRALPAIPSLSMPALFTHAEWAIPSPDYSLAPAPRTEIYEVSQVEVPPHALTQARPLYPPRARLQRMEGWVDLEFTVGTDGKIADLVVVGSSPDDTFVPPTLSAAARWTFQPGQHEGVPVPVRVRQRVSFELE